MTIPQTPPREIDDADIILAEEYTTICQKHPGVFFYRLKRHIQENPGQAMTHPFLASILIRESINYISDQDIAIMAIAGMILEINMFDIV